MKYAQSLRAQLAVDAEKWAASTGLPSYESLGKHPTVLFEAVADGSRHGNFHDLSWREIQANPGWAKRLLKAHSQKRALPEEKKKAARELDSSNSSDALLMNCFCFPDTARVILAALRLPATTELPEFGYNPRLALNDGGVDETEVDMRLGALLVEAKLTEANFTVRPKPHVLRYRDLLAVFDVNALPGNESSFSGYQLIRNILAAARDRASFVVLIDERRPDLIEEWNGVAGAIRDAELRRRCGFRTWQDCVAAAPPELRSFLETKYGL